VRLDGRGGTVTEFSDVRPGVRIFVLLLLLIVLTLGGIIWFDYLGLINAKDLFSPLYQLLGFQKRSAVAAADDPNLLDRERLAKEAQGLDVRQQELDARAAELDSREAKLTQLAQDLADKEAALTSREKAFIDQTNAFENRRANIEQSAQNLMSMTPAKAVGILDKREDQDVIDIFHAADTLAAQAGEDSLVPVWLSLMSPDRAATLMRKMERGTGG
jgi:flagellar protein FlbB